MFEKKIKNNNFYLFTFFKKKNKLKSILRDENCQMSMTAISVRENRLSLHPNRLPLHFL